MAQLTAVTPDILFLDIEMGQLNVMDTARLLRKQTAGTILIFVTSHPDYVFQGYEVKALHYILKPYKEQKILEVLDYALSELGINNKQAFLFSHKGSQRKLLQDISYFWSEGRKVQTRKAAFTFYGKLNEIELELPDSFTRIHNCYLVNLQFIEEISSTNVCCAGQSLPLSRANRQEPQLAFARTLLE